MAIVRLQPDVPPVVKYTTPETIQAPSNSIFTTLVPEANIQSLLKYVEGFPWTVDFYGQILNSNNTVEHFDPTTPNLTQPYYKVSGLILQVSSPLSSSYDQSTGITTITGSAITPYKLTPNVGDVFIARVDNGEDAIFHITSVSRKTYRKDTLYEINYSLYSYTSANPEFISTLSKRINDEYFFNTDSNFFNRDVLIKPSVKEATDRLKTFMYESQNYYFSTFTQKPYGALVIPGIHHLLYDPLLTNFISKIVDYDKLITSAFYRFTYTDPYIDQPSIFTALLSRSLSTLSNCNRRYNFIRTAMLNNRARLGTIAHTGIDYILYPVTPDTTLNVKERALYSRTEFINDIRTSDNYTGSMRLITRATNNNEVFTMSLLPELFKDDYYIVSENFYKYLQNTNSRESLSYIELLLYRFMNNEAISKEDLAIAVENYSSWSLLHKVYLLPVMWLLVRSNIG